MTKPNEHANDNAPCGDVAPAAHAELVRSLKSTISQNRLLSGDIPPPISKDGIVIDGLRYVPSDPKREEWFEQFLPTIERADKRLSEDRQ